MSWIGCRICPIWRTDIKLGATNFHAEVSVASRLMTSHLKIIFQFTFLDEGKQFLLKSKPAPILPISRNFVVLGTKLTS